MKNYMKNKIYFLCVMYISKRDKKGLRSSGREYRSM